MSQFDHEKLDVYHAAIAFVAVADDVTESIRPKRRNLRDQLDRAATSIVLNIAEGAGEFSANDKARFYRIARRSATECAAVLDICRRRNLVTEEVLRGGRGLLLRIVAMLTAMVIAISKASAEKPGSGSGSGSGSIGIGIPAEKV